MHLYQPKQFPSLPVAMSYDSNRSVPPVQSRTVASRFGLRLRQLRRERNLTQLDMAVTFGIYRIFISDFERGRKSMSLPMLEIVALGLQVSLSDLLRDL